MPIYVYEVLGEPCERCGERREELRKMSDEPLTACPECGRKLRRVPTAGAVQVNVLAASNVKEKGFKKFVRDKHKGGYREE